jgi:hypothetical protein
MRLKSGLVWIKKASKRIFIKEKDMTIKVAMVTSKLKMNKIISLMCKFNLPSNIRELLWFFRLIKFPPFISGTWINSLL